MIECKPRVEERDINVVLTGLENDEFVAGEKFPLLTVDEIVSE
jgi:hypothetical protein